jgi:phenylalanyl-tRNA synthetase beta chain
MKVSRAWLQKYFDTPLPSIEVLSDLFTFHAFEVEEVISEDVLDLKVLPDRAGYALSHRGIAAELAAIMSVPLKYDPLRTALPVHQTTQTLTITTDPAYVHRHMGAYVRGVKVGPSPAWLTEALEAVGQRSINNIVDITNYVMLDLGQPMHAFDARKISKSGEALAISIRAANPGEKVTILSGEEYTLTDSMYVIADATTGTALDIAGVKGGLASGITEDTTDLFISVGNYDAVTLRRVAQNLKLFTDATLRYQNRPSTELVAYGMRDVIEHIANIAGGTLDGVIDVWNQKPETRTVQVTARAISDILGASYSDDVVAGVCTRLQLPFTQSGDMFTITPPFERTDIQIPVDMAEEVGRIVGYDHVRGDVLPVGTIAPDQRRYRGIERIKDILIEQGFTEISTQSFAKKGDIQLANPLDSDHPYLRTALTANMLVALGQGKHYAELVLMPKEKVKLFEIGTIFVKQSEHLSLVVSEPALGLEVLGVQPTIQSGVAEYNLSKFDFDSYGEAYVPKKHELGMYCPFSVYPFVLRDIALWVPEGTTPDTVLAVIHAMGTELLKRVDLFDTFSKEGRTSYAFRLVFQSMDRTLTDDEVGSIMATMSEALRGKGWEVR